MSARPSVVYIAFRDGGIPREADAAQLAALTRRHDFAAGADDATAAVHRRWSFSCYDIWQTMTKGRVYGDWRDIPVAPQVEL